MTLYCNEGDQPKIEYTFNGKNKQIYEPGIAPIEVVLDQVRKNNYGEDYNAEGFTIISANGAEQAVINYRTRNGNEIQFWSCGSSDWDNRQPDGTYPVWYPLISPIVRIDKTRGCPPPIPPQDCIIKVYYQGRLLFSQRGECPIDYDVICGNCPTGYIECKTNRYPGYCCTKCSDIASKINNLVPKVRCCNG
ncbi:hypothetical protein NIES4106_53530 [Fischerella sp. NIES-4106]|nr:hypothetical protein NIES4106_10240 [Fischerella sp. NIES-4106]BAZ70558.1 hypothetical protein NIES4106_53530 [Fischerella sp. NIES-4106]